MRRSRLLGTATAGATLAALLLLAGCDDPTDPRIAAVASIELSPSSATLQLPGDTLLVTAVVRDSDGLVLEGVPIQWSSGNTAVAIVDSTGLVTAVGGGETTISAAIGSVSEGVEVSVATVGAPRVEVLLDGLSSPWALVQLPDGRFLVTQKGGDFVVVSAEGDAVLATIPSPLPVALGGQGGLLDVALDPGFDQNGFVYWTFAEPGTGAEAGLSGTAVARGVLTASAITDAQVIYRQHPKVSGSGHFGSRIAFRSDGTLFVTLGERQLGDPAQDVANTLGAVVRIEPDGSAPADNPAIPGAPPEMWSWGHRNPQGAAIHPSTGELWLTEHGPQGGDELNVVRGGQNFGWPVVSYGCNYGAPVGDACRIGGGAHAPAYIEPVSFWVPVSIAPSGMIFYTGSRFPEWSGDVVLGALADRSIWRVALNDDTESSRERLFPSLGERVRDVAQGLDGFIYFVTDSGRLSSVRR